jgi:glutaredoxin
MAERPKITLYTRSGCCLCEDAKRVLEAVRGQASFDLDEIDIDNNAELRRAYNDEVPVIAINGSKAFKYRVTEQELLKKLAARE